MKRLIVYDLDGTLVDTREDITRAANHMLTAMGGPALSREEVCRFVGKGLHQLVTGCLKTEDPATIETGRKIYRAYYTQHLLDYSRLYPGASEVLDYFRDRKQAVLTNKPNPYSRDILVGLGVSHFFVEIIGGETEFPRKPDPATLFFLMKKNGANSHETLFIGDSSVDVETGRNAGVLTVAMTHGFSDIEEITAARPDFIIDCFDEVRALAKSEKW